MAKSKVTPAIIIVEQQGLVFFTPHVLTGLSVPFPSGMVVNMEVVDSQKYYEWIGKIIEDQKFGDVESLLVIGQSLYFEKTVPATTDEKIEEEKKDFAHVTPFDRVAVQSYKKGTSTLLISMNRDFVDTVRQGLEKSTVVNDGVIPMQAILPYIGKEGLTPHAIKALFPRMDSLKEHPLVTSRTNPKTLQEKEEYLSSHYQGLIIVVFIAFLALVIGGTLFLLRRQSQSVAPPASIPVVVSPTPVASAAEPVEETEPLARLDASASALRIEVIASATSSTTSAAVVSLLRSEGYASVSARVQTGVVIQRPLLLFKSSVPFALRSQILDRIGEIVGTVTSQENNEISSEISITVLN